MSCLKMKHQIKKVAARVVLVALAIQASASAPASLARGSSYLDDYFLPTAKMALNKIQQSLGPVQADNLQSTNKLELLAELPTPNSTAPVQLESSTEPAFSAAPKTTEQSAPVAPVESGSAEPGTTRAETSSEPATSEPATGAKQATETDVARAGDEMLASSTQAGEPDPISAAPAAAEPDLAAGSGSDLVRAEPPSSSAASPSPLPAESRPSASAEEAARDAEQEAIAAVDASIGFGHDPFGSLVDSCYDEYGNARYCEPEFENVAFERQIEVSSECGQPASRFCTAYLNERNDQIRNCHICDAQHPKKRHPAAFLTDLSSSNSPTCWVSAPIQAAANESDWRLDNVTLEVKLEKKYEITYVSMQFCTTKPDSLAIYRSSDFGRSWSPYQFYSSQCKRVYGRPARAGGATAARSEPLEASCTNSSGPSTSARIAFSTLDGRPGGAHSSAAVQDWLTATNIKIALDRSPAPLLGHAYHHSGAGGAANASAGADESENGLTSPSDTYNYAMSDITIGGRCKCNGHASRCVHGRDGRLQCECRHNTAGRDCERCAPFHFDRPWARASPLDASPCQPCNCNGHSRKCRFDAELYRLSGRRSGGVCIRCQDNTAGRHCHYCTEGFTRDHSKAMSHKEACKPCDCHPQGSQGVVCNQTSGQCPCKEGVTGLQCNRCAPGYQQSSSPSEPCIKIPENDINYEPTDEPSSVVATGQSQEGAHGSRTPPASTTRNHNKPRPEADSQDSAPDQAQDKDEQEQPEPAEEQVRVSSRRPSRPWPTARKPYSYLASPRRPQMQQFADELPMDEDELDEEEIRTRPRPVDEDYPLPGRVYQTYSGYGKATRPFAGDYVRRRPLMGSRNRANEILLQPLASLDTDDSEESNYALYNEDNFNQIQTAPVRRLQLGPSRARGRTRFVDSAQSPEAPTCGDCQPSTRRLGFRQFCHLDYAIKATIHSRLGADDWTRFDLEILDVFKSPGSSSLLARGANYLDQPDQLGNRTAESASSDSAHRIKVGAMQSILVPTEDLSCKCPRLRLRSTYLLMGSTESKDNAERSMQLDRHGIALEWKSSLQEKLVKYQRRQARGRC